LRWETLPDAPVRNEGAFVLRPAPGEWGTEVTLRLGLHLPTPVARLADALNLVPRTLLGGVLRRLKSLVETGEIPNTAANPAARG